MAKKGPVKPENKIRALQRELKRVCRNIKEKCEELTGKDNQIDVLGKELVSNGRQIARLNEQAEQLNRVVKDLTVERNQYKDQIETLNAQVKQLRDDLILKITGRDSALKNADDLKQQLGAFFQVLNSHNISCMPKTLDERICHLRDKLSAKNEEFVQLCSRLDTLLKVIDDFDIDGTPEALAERLRYLGGELKKLEDQLREERSVRKRAEAEREATIEVGQRITNILERLVTVLGEERVSILNADHDNEVLEVVETLKDILLSVDVKDPENPFCLPARPDFLTELRKAFKTIEQLAAQTKSPEPAEVPTPKPTPTAGDSD